LVAGGWAGCGGAGTLLCPPEMGSCYCFGGVTAVKGYRTRADQREEPNGQLEMLSTITLPFFPAKELVRQQETSDMTTLNSLLLQVSYGLD